VLFLCPAVLVGMMLGGFSRVMRRVLGMPMGNMGMMASLLVIPGFVVLAGFTMMFRGVLVMLGRFLVVLDAFMC
jgi:hypothetical protein